MPIHSVIICLNLCESMGADREALQLHTVYKKSYFYCKSRQNPYQVLQVTHATSECAIKSKVRMIK